jgi:ankyrin repeat protein
LLLRNGADPHGVDADGISPLHRAVQSGSLAVAELLIAAGAEIDLRENKWRGTPLTWAIVLGQPHMAKLLAPLSRDVRGLAALPDLARLEQVLVADPALANHQLDVEDRPTPLFCLPEDENEAAAVAEMLLNHGADPSTRNRHGRTAADVARQRGLDDAADLIETFER